MNRGGEPAKIALGLLKLTVLMRLQRLEPQVRGAQARLEPGQSPVGRDVTIQDTQRLMHFSRLYAETLDEIGKRADLDVDAVIAICDKVINTVRDDLRGRYGID